MSSQKPEAKAADQDDGDHTQPINLVAQRAPVPVTTFTGPSSQSSVIPPVTMRAHIEPPKPGLMTLYFRTPTASRQPGPTQVMAAQVAPAQHFTAKSGFKGFKSVKVGYYQDKTTEKSGSEFNIKVIRMPTNDASQSPGIGSTQPATSSSLSAGMMPSTLNANANRHVPSAVHSVIAGGSTSSGPMASIIRGAHQVSQTGHLMHQPYSSHVPRGPAAVASISAAPKSAVATPILRPPHSSATMTLAPSSSMMSSHQPVRARSPILLPGRMSTPSVSVVPSSTLSQVIDLQKSSVGHSLSANPVQINLNPRTLESSGIRAGHPSSITITKPINISQPIVQHLQQVSDKSFSKGLSSTTSVASSPSNTIPAHQSSSIISSTQTSGTDALTVGVPTITRTAVSASSSLSIPPSNMYSSTVIPLPSAAAVSQHVVPALRPSLVHPQSVHSLSTTCGPVVSQPTYTVISTKTTVPQSNQTMSLSTPASRTALPSSSVVVTTGPISTASVLSVATTRPLNTPNSVCQTAIPVAKVYPQPLPAVQSNMDLSVQDNRNTSFGTQSQGSSGTSSGSITAVVTTTVSSAPQTVMVSEKRNESSAAVRFASLTKAQVGGGASYTVPSSYFYEQFPNALAMHHYPVNVGTSNQNFSSPLQSSSRPGTFSQHSSSSLTASTRSSIAAPANPITPVQPLNSLMVTVEPTHRQNSKHLPYNAASGGLPNSEIAQTTCATANLCTLTNSSNTAVGLNSTPVVATNYNSVQSQGNVSNHNTSPRPSILRKRTSDSMNSQVKKNLMTANYGSEPVSPRPDMAPSNSSRAPSPKSSSEHLKENGTANVILESEKISVIGGAMVTIKKEPGIFENNVGSSNGDATIINSIPAEASPRKKPRKQLFSPEKYRLKNVAANNGAVSEFIEAHSSDCEEEFERDCVMSSKEGAKSEEENVKWVTFCKRPTMSLLNSYRHAWKSRNNHFVRYTDVKAKEEKKATINELANQKGIIDRASAWKIYHLSGQLDEVVKLESSVYSRLSQLLEFIEDTPRWKSQMLNSEDNKILNKLNDLTKGNLQRSKLAQEQMAEGTQNIMKLVDHHSNIVEVLNKYVSKRPIKKKEKT